MNYQETLDGLEYCKSLATFLQQMLCINGTTQGDGRSCGCIFATSMETIKKQIKNGEGRKIPSVERTGCCETRTIIREIERIIDSLKEENNPDNLKTIIREAVSEALKKESIGRDLGPGRV